MNGAAKYFLKLPCAQRAFYASASSTYPAPNQAQKTATVISKRKEKLSSKTIILAIEHKSISPGTNPYRVPVGLPAISVLSNGICRAKLAWPSK
jgi:hypothetical protein